MQRGTTERTAFDYQESDDTQYKPDYTQDACHAFKRTDSGPSFSTGTGMLGDVVAIAHCRPPGCAAGLGASAVLASSGGAFWLNCSARM